MAAQENAKNSDSILSQEGTPTTFWTIGRAEMKQQAKKETIKQQKKKRKRKAEGNHQLRGNIAVARQQHSFKMNY